jgi:hypothetical protein
MLVCSRKNLSDGVLWYVRSFGTFGCVELEQLLLCTECNSNFKLATKSDNDSDNKTITINLKVKERSYRTYKNKKSDLARYST